MWQCSKPSNYTKQWYKYYITITIPDPTNVNHRRHTQDMRPVSPSGVPLASALTANDGGSRTCVRTDGPENW